MSDCKVLVKIEFGRYKIEICSCVLHGFTAYTVALFDTYTVGLTADRVKFFNELDDALESAYYSVRYYTVGIGSEEES